MKRPPIIVVQLVHILGPMKGEIQEFAEPAIAIGRHPSCHVHFPVDMTNISRKHAEIVREGNQFKLVDSSANGTFVNGKKVTEAYLKNGDVLEFAEGGPKVSFLTQMKEDSSAVETPPPPPKKETPVYVKPEPRVERREAEPPPIRKPEAPPLREEEPEEKILVQSVKAPLIIQYGPTLRSYKELPITLGKNPKCHFVINHPAIFDQQAQIFFSQNQYWIKDLTGQSSIRINRRPIAQQAPLKMNDELALSPQGPFFHFLGEGRLAEAEPLPDERPSSPREQRKEETKGKPQEEKSSKGLFSVFKKIVDR